VDLTGVEGSGPGGAILLADVERAVAGPPAPKLARGARFDPAAMRAAVAAAMARSKREIPHYYLAHQVDLQPAAEWLDARNAERPPQERLLMGLLLIRAAALGAAAVPGFSGTFEDGAFRPSEGVHAGVAVALRGGGLVAPALRDADSRPLDALMPDMRDLVARARAGRLRASEFTDPTLTVSSLGERGADALYGVIFPPQVAIIGFGTPVERPAVVGGAVAPRLTVAVTLSADHRVSDGRQGARLLSEIAARLQSPEGL
jgi:pyruvate dehydrogenase E2 component (dihydrolipoamide acetyltransferase)